MTELPYYRQLVDARAWIDRLPGEVTAQAVVLTRLLEWADGDERIRAVSLEGSMARGDADELSDLDTRIWVTDEEFDSALADLPSVARTIGAPIDILFETPGSHYLFVHYADGVQLELLTLRASEATGAVSGELVLMDRDGRLRGVEETPALWDVNLWLGWAWMRLFDLDKHLRRGVLWKALIKLEEARSLLLSHHAATIGVPEPQLGLVSILNANGTLPARLEETVAGLDAVDLRLAARVCAELLATYERRPFGDLVRGRLAAGD